MRESVTTRGNRIYNDIKNDIQRCTAYRTELSRLIDSRNLDPNGDFQVTSATVNGQAMAGQLGQTNAEREAVLSHVVKCLNNGGPISNTQYSTF